MSAVAYLDGLDFAPDRFQIEAAKAIDKSESILVTAPTGSGKTAIAEAAIHRALELGSRAIYTTPIKALSNQKYGELSRRYGPEGVGLLTGDNSINGSAPVVVMTTEVLRNMMFTDSPDLTNVAVVVLDEVHYLQDRERGAVWEEIIIHLDQRTSLVCLSATVANAAEFAAWIQERRGPTTLISEQERPVPLEATYLIRDRFTGHELRLFPVFADAKPNQQVISLLKRDRSGRGRYVEPRRHETSEFLRRRGLLPAIFFIFSRKGCEIAAQSVVGRGLRLTTKQEAEEIVALAVESTAGLSEDDLDVLGFSAWIDLLAQGVATHHAGMVPVMKETVERLFAAGLVKLVFATETLALGINMPARTVVIESLSKFNGETHENLRPGDFTQLTGRAGRRGIDTAGTAVVLHSRHLEFEGVAGIAARGSHPLLSSFRPTYNTAVNLIARYDRHQAERLLAASFAEFSLARRDRDRGSQIDQEQSRLEELRAEAEHPDLDIWARLDVRGPSHAAVMAQFVATTAPGAIVEWDDRAGRRRAMVVAVGRGKQPRLLGVTETGESRRFASGKLPTSIRLIGHIDLPRPFRPQDPEYLARAAELLAEFEPTAPPQPAYASELDTPVDIDVHLAAARAARRLEVRIASMRTSSDPGKSAVVTIFRARRAALDSLDYTAGWSLTDKGAKLRSLYNGLDLVLAECLATGLFASLTPPQLAGIASAYTFEPRRLETPSTWPLELTEVGDAIDRTWKRVSAVELAHGLEPNRAPDPGLAATIMAWSKGATLVDLFDSDDPGIGDFVRGTRQVLDLLRQIADTEEIPEEIARSAIRSIERGVVASAGAL